MKILFVLLASTCLVGAAIWSSYPSSTPTSSDTFLFSTASATYQVSAQTVANKSVDIGQQTIYTTTSTNLDFNFGNNFVVSNTVNTNIMLTFTNIVLQSSRVKYSTVVLLNNSSNTLSYLFNTNSYLSGGTLYPFANNGTNTLTSSNSISYTVYFY